MKRSHLWLLLGWPVYFALYVLTENLIPAEACHLIHCALDDLIPFCEYFAVFYVGWYVLLAGSLLLFGLRRPECFVRLQTYIIIVQILATLAFLVYPSRQDLRPESFPRMNLLSAIMGLIYAVDTPTGVCPSLHVAISVGIASVWLRADSVNAWVKMSVTVFCIMVCLSVCFVKQHSVVDILAAIPVCLTAEWLVFFKKRNL